MQGLSAGGLGVSLSDGPFWGEAGGAIFREEASTVSHGLEGSPSLV